MRIPVRSTLVAGAVAGLAAGGLLTPAAADACTEQGKNPTPVTEVVHENEATIDLVLAPVGRNSHEDVEPLTCQP